MIGRLLAMMEGGGGGLCWSCDLVQELFAKLLRSVSVSLVFWFDAVLLLVAVAGFVPVEG